jgi:toxin-antitoxin system PIN domain toxin
MFVVDTNLLIYAANEDSPFHDRCRSLLDRWRERSDAWFLSWGIVYEFLRVVTHPRVLRRPPSIATAWSFVDGLLSSPGLIMLSESARHAEVARALIDETPGLAGNILHDTRTAVLMREHGVRRIYTRDTDFHRFRFLEVVDPVVAD